MKNATILAMTVLIMLSGAVFAGTVVSVADGTGLEVADGSITATATGEAYMYVGTYVSIGDPHAGIFFVPLPVLPAGNRPIGANLTLGLTYCSTSGESWNIDLYALGVTDSPALDPASQYYFGANDTSAVRIQDNLVPPGSHPDQDIDTDASGDAALTSWLSSQYTDGAPNAAYAVFRLNLDAAPTAIMKSSRFKASDAAYSDTGQSQPTLTIDYSTSSSPYVQWSNGPSTNADYFPLGVWMQDPSTASQWKAANVNHFVYLWNGPTVAQLDMLQAADMQVIAEMNENAAYAASLTLSDGRPLLIGWASEDEPDNYPQTWTVDIQQLYADIKAFDTTRPVWLGLSQGLGWDSQTWVGQGGAIVPALHYPAYLEGTDIMGMDIYPMDRNRPETAGAAWRPSLGTDGLYQYGGTDKPAWNAIETGDIVANGFEATVEEIKMEIWSCIIHGSKGITYFIHGKSSYGDFDQAALLRPEHHEQLTGITLINAEILSLAPVINSDTIIGEASVVSSNPSMPIDFMVKEYNGDTYVFSTGMRDLTADGTFTFYNLGNATVEVIGESRTIEMTAGEFTDSFFGFDTHLYRIVTNASFNIHSTLSGSGSATPSIDVEVARGGTTQIVYTAAEWCEILDFTTDGVLVADAIGETEYTMILSNVLTDISNDVVFAAATAPADGVTPATWYGPLGADPEQEDEDGDSLSLYVEYLLNTDPTVSNIFEIAENGIAVGDLPFVTWESLGLPSGDLGVLYSSNLVEGFWSNSLDGTLAHASGATTWTADAPLLDPAGFFKLVLNYEEPPEEVGEDFENGWAGPGTLVVDPDNPANTVLELTFDENIAIAMPTNQGIVTMRIYDRGATDGDTESGGTDYGPRWGVAGSGTSSGVTIINKSNLDARLGYGYSTETTRTSSWFSQQWYGGPRQVDALQIVGSGTPSNPDVPGDGRWTTWTFSVDGSGSVTITDGAANAQMTLGLGDLVEAWVSGGRIAYSPHTDMASIGVLVDDIDFTAP